MGSLQNPVHLLERKKVAVKSSKQPRLLKYSCNETWVGLAVRVGCGGDGWGGGKGGSGKGGSGISVAAILM